MRFKFSLEVLSQISGNVIPISYQYELSNAFRQLLTSDKDLFDTWLKDNYLPDGYQESIPLYSVSNLYVPKIFVEGDRLTIKVPIVQFWVSFLPEVGTRELLQTLEGKEIVIGDSKSSVTFKIQSLQDVSPVYYHDQMEYQSLSPIVVKALRSNGTIEFMDPSNNYFAQFMYDGIVERWEHYQQRPFDGIQGFNFMLLDTPRRKSVNYTDARGTKGKVVGYMMRFRIDMDPMLQQFAYTQGFGDDINDGFGYVELINKRK